MIQDVSVRLATAKDVADLAGLIDELLDQHFVEVPDKLREALERDGFGDAPQFEALVAEMEGKVVGMALFYPTYRPSLACAGLLMEDLYVVEKVRRHGVGNKLVAWLAKLALERGYGYLEWTVELENMAARKFYQDCGATLREGKVSYQLSGDAFETLAGGG